MPAAIPKPCAHPRCNELLGKGKYCTTHARKAEAERRQRYGSAAQRGYDANWQRYRKNFLAEYPLCGMSPNKRREAAFGCRAGGRVTAAREIDHIIPRAERMDLFWEPANHQALCRECHRLKTADDARGEGGAKELVGAT